MIFVLLRFQGNSDGSCLSIVHMVSKILRHCAVHGAGTESPHRQRRSKNKTAGLKEALKILNEDESKWCFIVVLH